MLGPRLMQIFALLLAGASVSSCSSAPRSHSEAFVSSHTLPRPQIVATAPKTQCVPYARRISDIHIRGDAWTWWDAARRGYSRSKMPIVGSVMVLSKTNRLHYGHLAVVTHVVNNREILVEHANWLNQGHIHKNQLVRDVSPRGDWSQVKLWYTPGNTMGVTVYPVSGFVHAGSGKPAHTLSS